MKKSLENIVRNGLKLVSNTQFSMIHAYNTILADIDVG
jgi:hypothetical protein